MKLPKIPEKLPYVVFEHPFEGRSFDFVFEEQESNGEKERACFVDEERVSKLWDAFWKKCR